MFLFIAPFMWRDCRAALARHWHESRWVVFAFMFNFCFALLCYVVRPEATANNLEKPLRMFLAVTVLMLVLVARPPRRALWWGVIAGTLAALALVAYQRLGQHIDRPGGLINPITFGDLSLCMALLAVVATIDIQRGWRMAWPVLGALAGIAAALFTGTRGALVALLPVGLVLLQARLVPGRRVRALVAAGLLICGSAYFVPSLGMQDRVAEGVDDVRAWSDGGSKDTSLGIRLELWKGAVMLIQEHPLFGIDANLTHGELRRYVQQGLLDRAVLPMPHMHNDGLQAFATGGIVGFAAWFSLLAAPFAFFWRALGQARASAPQQLAPALAGLLVVLCYFSFGLTEVIFWSVKGSMFYAFMVFLLMGYCLNAKESIGK
ncbi:O-antigen ligase family protein [Massilia horti]|uniref:O-antigen ligase family protein n=1 Tax=Massilia horti TaxID=2562153 RepID=UPI001E44E45E|nr:O-antigen ligase family protein [Massilia horti]